MVNYSIIRLIPQFCSTEQFIVGSSTHHDQVDEGDSIGVDPQQVHTAKHVQDDHTHNQHEDGSRPHIQTKHQNGHKEHSSWGGGEMKNLKLQHFYTTYWPSKSNKNLPN